MIDGPKYAARRGSRLSDDDADAIGRYIEALPERTPEAMLDAARRDRSCPYRDRLKLNDDEGAAELWRVDQCQRIIKAVVIREPDGVESRTALAAFHLVKNDAGNRSYETVDVVQRNLQMRAQVLARMKAEAASYIRRFQRAAEEFDIEEAQRFLQSLARFAGVACRRRRRNPKTDNQRSNDP